MKDTKQFIEEQQANVRTGWLDNDKITIIDYLDIIVKQVAKTTSERIRESQKNSLNYDIACNRMYESLDNIIKECEQSSE